MRNNERCLKCGEKTFEIKKIAVPTTKTTKAKIGIDMFYLKIFIYALTKRMMLLSIYQLLIPLLMILRF